MFEAGMIYRRRALHERYGGSWQSGITAPAHHPIVFVFTGETGEQYGYKDGWQPDGSFLYTGEGQVGDMTLTRGNRAILDHAANGRDLHLFKSTARGEVQYCGQMVCAGYEQVPNVPDREGNRRIAIVFRLVPFGAVAEPDLSFVSGEERPQPAGLWSAPLADVRARALEGPPADATPGQAMRTVYQRSEAVRAYVLRRAEGVCEGCGQPAPFVTPAGRPYLEPHHTRRLSDGGPDHPRFVIALCPTCHRRAHHAADGHAFNAGLVQRLESIEAAS